VVLVLAVAGLLYGRGWWGLRVRGARALASGWRLAAYLGGLAAIAVALLSAIEYLAEISLTAHMVQHQLLLMTAPPLLLLAEPFPMGLWGLPGRARPTVGRLLAPRHPVRTVLAWLTWLPVAGALYAVNLGAWHLPVAYEAALRHPVVHDLEHVAFFATAVLFWWPVVNPAPRLHRLTSGLQYGYRIAYLILATGLNTLLGAVLGLSERVLYPSYAAAPQLWGGSALDDQALGGGIMWSGGHMFLVAILVLVSRALRADDRSPAEGPALPREPASPGDARPFMPNNP
jgi:cytochrome c oxidase assembly factor CtaG